MWIAISSTASLLAIIIAAMSYIKTQRRQRPRVAIDFNVKGEDTFVVYHLGGDAIYHLSIYFPRKGILGYASLGRGLSADDGMILIKVKGATINRQVDQCFITGADAYGKIVCGKIVCASSDCYMKYFYKKRLWGYRLPEESRIFWRCKRLIGPTRTLNERYARIEELTKGKTFADGPSLNLRSRPRLQLVGAGIPAQR